MFNERNLLSLAQTAADESYSPYSGFKVGAALLCADGSVYLGTNIENSSYSATLCAERVAFSKAIIEGKREFLAIAVVGGLDDLTLKQCYPCGVCLQFMSEFVGDGFEVLLTENNIVYRYLLNELLPKGFELKKG